MASLVSMLDPQLANRLAAFATLVTDAVEAASDGLSASAVAALQTVRQTGPTAIQDIAHAVGLSHSATVRLVDRLEKDWLVRRLRRKGREVRVEATARGKRRATQILERRQVAVEAVLAGLAPEAREALAAAVDTMLATATAAEPTQAARICRSCDRGGCRAADCPVAAAERAAAPQGATAG
ncbi:MarR family transcriptional regulator [Siculibacillus lacustris]|uniref:MarR family transcriptional regulator n=1 Tax=Siculibacillus lacustris TaxID=1549641 RepID=A0A4Q9VNW6_9HYPH|nr:MarR family transcriptional regulator [Siculibacillus lacustris]TBW36454.1 MarR family transcriptional regulator [Siculibacillus lacustris]